MQQMYSVKEKSPTLAISAVMMLLFYLCGITVINILTSYWEQHTFCLKKIHQHHIICLQGCDL